MINASAYRFLIVDDELPMCLAARKQIERISGPAEIYVDEAYTARVAMTKIGETFFDLVLLDLYKERTLAGYEVFRKFNETGCAVDVIFMTRFDLDPSVKTLLKALASEGSARLVGFVDKREQESIRSEVEKRYKAYAAAEFEVNNLALAGRIISSRRSRYRRPGIFPLRESPSEIDAEVERLLRQLYVEVRKTADRVTDVSVSLEPIERRGLSAAVVVNATVMIGLHGVREVQGGHKTVLKIGPKPDILEEASRYREFVRYGVELDQRVELLGTAVRDSLGGLVYSFAGGLYRKELLSLDDVLILDLKAARLGLAAAVLRGLFTSKHWYEVHADDVEVARYFRDNYSNDLMKSFGQGEKALYELPDLLGDRVKVRKVEAHGREDSHFAVAVGDRDALIVPDSSVLGLGLMYGSVPACLVHGDMHAGNVMLEVSEGALSAERDRPGGELAPYRVCLIDFRNAGPGPRTIDAVALESSVRLADAEAVCRRLSAVG